MWSKNRPDFACPSAIAHGPVSSSHFPTLSPSFIRSSLLVLNSSLSWFLPSDPIPSLLSMILRGRCAMDHSFSTIISPLCGWVIYQANYSGSQRKIAFRTTKTSQRSKVCSSRSSCFSATPSGSNISGPSLCYKPSTPPGVAYSSILIDHGFHPRLLTFKPFGLVYAIPKFLCSTFRAATQGCPCVHSCPDPINIAALRLGYLSGHLFWFSTKNSIPNNEDLAEVQGL